MRLDLNERNEERERFFDLAGLDKPLVVPWGMIS